MPYFPQLPSVATYRVTTDRFLGLDRNVRTEDGTFADMLNMSGDDYPVLSTRRPRTFGGPVSNPQGMIAKDALFWVDGTKLYNNGVVVEGVTLSTSVTMCPKTLLSMGAYLLIWPDKIYVNTADLSEYGYIEQKNSVTGTISYSLCKNDGTAYDSTPVVAPQAPASPDNEALWIDSSAKPHALKQFDAASGQWVEIATTYVKIAANDIGLGLSQYDGITISGCAADAGEDPDIAEQITALNGTVIAYDADEDYIVVVGILDAATDQTSGTVKAERLMPDMDFLCEAQNRIWGCKYGLSTDGQTLNEIYCSALGDFKNWNQFMGLSTDSWVGSQGTDGQWTGAIAHLGYPCFFKENYLHKVYISSKGAHQVVVTTCRGVQKGSDRSLAIVDEQLYYKARAGVMRYDGSLPVCISDALGTGFYYEATGGAFGQKYYISMQGEDGVWGLYVYDTARGFWHKEDDLHVLWFAKIDDSLVMIDDGGRFIDENGVEGSDAADYVPEEFDWSATTGIIGLEYPDQKRLYRYNIRLDLAEDARCIVEVQYDGTGDWIPVARGFGRGLGTVTIPVVPRRCDHMQVRISGHGQAKIYSFARILELSGDKQ